MKRKTRYLLLAVGFVTFLILAPLIVFYTSGTWFDFGNKEYVSTGIISADTEPGDAEVFINGVKNSSTPTSIRFLSPDTYVVRVEKKGYFGWEKRLAVKEGKVTWVNDHEPKLQLLKQSTPQRVTTGIIDAAWNGNKVYALAPKSLSIIDPKNIGKLESITLPENSSRIISHRGALFLLAGQTRPLLVDVGGKSVQLLPKGLSPQDVIWFDDTQAIILEQGNVHRIALTSGARTLLFTHCTAATTVGDTLYYIDESSPTSRALMARTFSEDTIAEPNTIFNTLPHFSNTKLIVTAGKEIFIYGDQSLYRIGDTLALLAEHVTAVQGESGAEMIAFTTASELFSYDPAEIKPTLITRFSNSIGTPILRRDIGYVFFMQGPELIALETDNRDRQNRYTLAALTGSGSFAMDSGAHNIAYIDSGTLSLLEIRE
jgi:hypothetical protein